MTAARKYPPELKERAVRLVLEARKEDEALTLNAAAVRIATRVGVNKKTLYGWYKQALVDRDDHR